MSRLLTLLAAVTLSTSSPAVSRQTSSVRLDQIVTSSKVPDHIKITPKEMENYFNLLENIENKRHVFKQKYQKAKTKRQKKKILNQARNFVFKSLRDDIIPY